MQKLLLIWNVILTILLIMVLVVSFAGSGNKTERQYMEALALSIENSIGYTEAVVKALEIRLDVHEGIINNLLQRQGLIPSLPPPPLPPPPR